ncbi:MAG: hypothetical protein ACR2L1_09355 [Pyrinomonadaceae bacterium]
MYIQCRVLEEFPLRAVVVAVCRKADDDHLIVVSSEQSGRILLEYGERWRIETLFGNLKTRDFRLEDTHLTDGTRIGKLLSLLTLAGCWALLAGEFESAAEPIKIKKHARSGKECFPAWVRYFAKLFLPDSNKLKTKAAVSTTYITFVLYLETNFN